MASYSEAYILEKCQGMYESQKNISMQCFAASKVKNSKNRRYS